MNWKHWTSVFFFLLLQEPPTAILKTDSEVSLNSLRDLLSVRDALCESMSLRYTHHSVIDGSASTLTTTDAWHSAGNQLHEQHDSSGQVSGYYLFKDGEYSSFGPSNIHGLPAFKTGHISLPELASNTGLPACGLRLAGKSISAWLNSAKYLETISQSNDTITIASAGWSIEKYNAPILLLTFDLTSLLFVRAEMIYPLQTSDSWTPLRVHQVNGRAWGTGTEWTCTSIRWLESGLALPERGELRVVPRSEGDKLQISHSFELISSSIPEPEDFTIPVPDDVVRIDKVTGAVVLPDGNPEGFYRNNLLGFLRLRGASEEAIADTSAILQDAQDNPLPCGVAACSIMLAAEPSFTGIAPLLSSAFCPKGEWASVRSVLDFVEAMGLDFSAAAVSRDDLKNLVGPVILLLNPSDLEYGHYVFAWFYAEKQCTVLDPSSWKTIWELDELLLNSTHVVVLAAPSTLAFALKSRLLTTAGWMLLAIGIALLLWRSLRMKVGAKHA